VFTKLFKVGFVFAGKASECGFRFFYQKTNLLTSLFKLETTSFRPVVEITRSSDAKKRSDWFLYLTYWTAVRRISGKKE
jgi:hypothetical protein